MRALLTTPKWMSLTMAPNDTNQPAPVGAGAAPPMGVRDGLGGSAISHVGGDLPGVTPFIAHHTATVAIGHVRWLFQ